MSATAIGVVMNPIAGGGRMAAVWPDIAAALRERLGPFELVRTSRPGDATAFGQRFAQDGFSLVIAAGGDGTAGEVADGLLRVRQDVQLGLLPVGTGRDLARTLAIKRDEAAIEALASGSTRTIDAGRVSFVGDNGALAVRHFINIASLGLSGPTVRAVNRGRHAGRPSGKVLFFYHTVTQLLGYRPVTVRIVIDDGAALEARIAVVAICNGRFFGGGMKVAPDAALDDGLLDVVIFRAAGKIETILKMPRLYSGAHVGDRHVTIARARRVVVTPIGEPALLDVDGESPGRIPATFEVLPRALTIRG